MDADGIALPTHACLPRRGGLSLKPHRHRWAATMASYRLFQTATRWALRQRTKGRAIPYCGGHLSFPVPLKSALRSPWHNTLSRHAHGTRRLVCAALNLTHFPCNFQYSYSFISKDVHTLFTLLLPRLWQSSKFISCLPYPGCTWASLLSRVLPRASCLSLSPSISLLLLVASSTIYLLGMPPPQTLCMEGLAEDCSVTVSALGWACFSSIR